MSIDEIEAVALELPDEERAELVSRLQNSLLDDEVDQAWRVEVRRRLDLIEAGEVEWIEEEELFAELDADP